MVALTMGHPIIREYTDADATGVLHVVRSVFEEYGFTWDEGEYFADVRDVRGHFLAGDGAFWVVRDSESVVGCAGVTVHAGVAELHRMYLLKSYRGRGLGQQLFDACVDEARRHGAKAMRIWSDVKLPDAHKLYLKNGFHRDGERDCDDPDNSREFGFWREPL